MLHLFLQSSLSEANEDDVWVSEIRDDSVILISCQVVKALISAGADVDLPDKSSSMTPLHYAAMGGYVDMVDALIGGQQEGWQGLGGDWVRLQPISCRHLCFQMCCRLWL